MKIFDILSHKSKIYRHINIEFTFSQTAYKYKKHDRIKYVFIPCHGKISVINYIYFYKQQIAFYSKNSDINTYFLYPKNSIIHFFIPVYKNFYLQIRKVNNQLSLRYSIYNLKKDYPVLWGEIIHNNWLVFCSYLIDMDKRFIEKYIFDKIWLFVHNESDINIQDKKQLFKHISKKINNTMNIISSFLTLNKLQ